MSYVYELKFSIMVKRGISRTRANVKVVVKHSQGQDVGVVIIIHSQGQDVGVAIIIHVTGNQTIFRMLPMSTS